MALLLDRQQRLAEHELYLEACGNLKNLWSNPFSKDAVTNKVCEQELVALKNALKIAHEHLENGDHQNFFRNESDACKWQVFLSCNRSTVKKALLGNGHLVRAMDQRVLSLSNGPRDYGSAQASRESAANCCQQLVILSTGACLRCRLV